MRRPTINDVAKAVGVTKASVSMALRNKPGVSDAMRRKIVNAATELGYISDSARNTRGRQISFQLALLLVHQDPPRTSGAVGGSYLGGIVDGFVAGCQETGFSAVVSRTHRDQVDAADIAFIMRRQVDAVAVRGWMPDRLLKLLESISLPFVMLDCDRTIPDVPQVKIANLDAMGLLVDRLVQMKRRRIASITGDLGHANGLERLAGTQAALARHGLRIKDSQLIVEHGFDEESGRRGCRRLLATRGEFDALICHNDLIALGALDEMRRLDPERLRRIVVTGFDNMDFRSFVDPAILSIDPNAWEMGRFTAELLSRHVADGSKISRTDYTLPCQLVDDRPMASGKKRGDTKLAS